MYSSTKVAVIGAGLMGCGIAQVFASKNIPVNLYDAFDAARNTARDKIATNLQQVGQTQAALDYITITDDLEAAVKDADFLIEAVPEKLELKRQVFAEILQFVKPECILASNTSVIPISDIATGMDFGNRIVGTHWWNPPYLVPLVEVVQSEQSSLTAVQSMIELLRHVGKEPVHVQKDVPGFVGNRLQHALWREAIALINDGVCSAETVDIVVKNSFGMRLPVLGPIENADLVGLDLTLDIHNVILPSINRDCDPAEVLKQKVEAGELGIKSGTGFKDWTDESAAELRENLSRHLVAVTTNQQ